MAVGLHKLLQLVVDKKASELRLTVGSPPSLRIHGTPRPLNLPPLTPDDTLRFMRALAPERYQQEFKERGSCEFGFPFGHHAHFFVAVFTREGHCRIKIRLVPRKPPEVHNEDG